MNQQWVNDLYVNGRTEQLFSVESNSRFSCHILNQSEVKFTPTVASSHKFSHARRRIT